MNLKKFVLPVLLLFFIMTSLNFYYYRLVDKSLQAELVGKIKAIAESVKAIIEGRELYDEFFEIENDKIFNTIQDISDKFDLENIETIDYFGNITNSTNATFSSTLSQFEFMEKERELLILGHGIIIREVHKIDNVEFLTALIALEFPKGSGLIVLDIDLSYLQTIKDARKNFLIINVISIFLFILITFVTFVLSSKLQISIAEKTKQDKLAIIGKMTAAIAHEIKNPLGIIKNSADLIKRKYQKDSKDELFEYMNEEIDRLDLTVRDFLSFSGEIKIVPEKINPVVEIEKLILQMEDVTFSSGGIGIINFDPLRFVQLVRNVVFNAKTHGKGLVEIVSVKRTDALYIEVLDRGPGFPVLRESEVFEPFYTTSTSGTGLGLSVCKMIVEKHGGKIYAKNREGGGARLVIKLGDSINENS